jgi:arginyl-tRNA synthetase
MSIVNRIKEPVSKAIKELYQYDIAPADLTINSTKPEFDGDYTLVMFSLLKPLKKSPESIGNELGQYLVDKEPTLFTAYNVIKGFLNLVIADEYWMSIVQNNFDNLSYGFHSPVNQKVIVEYSSPNTNKPIHLGHLRNNFLGWSVAQILKANGCDVVKTCIVNDRGIHICKSMIAWQRFANGATPQSTGIKGDHLVGEYYVKFSQELKKQSAPILAAILDGKAAEYFDTAELPKINLQLEGMAAAKTEDKIAKHRDELKDIAENKTEIMQATKQMLVDWENNVPEVIELWKKMNAWVYAGFDVTYERIGSDFKKMYYESETYLPGKRFVEEGLEQGVFFRKPDGSTWIDLTDEGLDEKLVLRKDGTSVYITQDLGLAEEKYRDFHYDQSIYVIADEQNYHMKVLKHILQKLGKPYAEGIFHLSYGMVELPDGRMKSREGNVVDADELIEEMVAVARNKTEELGKVKDFTADELTELYDTIALGALKFFLLRVDPKKRMIFNPEESIDFHGFTGPFVQYTYARTRSILRKAADQSISGKTDTAASGSLHKLEKDLLIALEQYPVVIEQVAVEHNPSLLAIYVFELAKSFNKFLTELSVMNAESDEKRHLRLQLCSMVSNTIKSAMGLLGIRVPERM